MKRSLSVLLLLASPALMPRLLHAQLDTCYKAKIDGNCITYRGSVWLAILRADAKWRNATGNNAVGDDSISPLKDSEKPAARKCTGAMETVLQNAPDFAAANARYLGKIESAGQFRKLSEMRCGAGTPTATYVHQFFTIGDVVLYRYCGTGDDQGYIYFWGRTGKTASQCFKSSYPAMYGVLNTYLTANRLKIGLDDVRAVETKGDLGTKIKDAGAAALANDWQPKWWPRATAITI
jgi:hypothetical protein